MRASVKRVCQPRPAESNNDRYIHCMGMRANCYLSSVILLSLTNKIKHAECHDPISLDFNRIDPSVTVDLASRRLTKATATRNSVAVPIEFDERSQ